MVQMYGISESEMLCNTEESMRTYEELTEFMEEENVEFIRLAYFDVFGRQKNIAIMAGELERAMRYGISIDGSAIAGFDADIHSDLFLRPDPTTLTIVPWRPTAGRVCRMFCDVCYQDGTPIEQDTRRILKEAVQAAAEEGIDVKFGSEMEFYVFCRDENGKVTDRPIDEAGYMDVEPLDAGENLRRDICYALVDMGITPESSHHERGPGQMEIDFRYSDPLTAADNTCTVKWAIRSICASCGYYADFTPKPLRGKSGSGMHLNISVHNRSKEDKEDHTDAFMAGILANIREITLFLNPYTTSYDRFGKMEAPRYVSWAVQNRSQLIRIPADPSGRRRIELRSPDSGANPYLAFALLIYAGLQGIREGMEPQPPLDVNLYKAGKEIKGELEKLPETRDEAARLAADSEFVRRHVPAACLEAYVNEEEI